MTNNWTIAITVALGLVFAIAVVLIARRGILSMRYTLGWLFVAACVVAAGLLGRLIKPIASALDLDPAVVLLGFASFALLCLTVQLSITVSGLTERARTLAEASAILKERLDRLEQQSDNADS
jgi:hypothetical protein